LQSYSEYSFTHFKEQINFYQQNKPVQTN